MIAKAVKGRGFRGALTYDLKRSRAGDRYQHGGTTPRELAKEFGEVRNLRPKVGKAVLHVSLSAAPGEHLSDEQWRQVATRYLQGMGLENNQYIVTRHLDTEHEHVHLLVNRIRFDGGITSDSHDYRRQEILMRTIEREYGLQRVPPSIDVERHAPTKGEIEEGLRTGQPSTRQQLQQLCDAAAKDCDNFSDYEARLDAVDVQLVPVLQLEGRKLSGLSYLLDGVMMKGSDLGKGYSPMGLAKRGVGYDKERDIEAASRCIERSQAGQTEPADRALREAKLTSAEELATLLEPLAQAMAALTDETRASLEQVQEYNKEQSKQFLKQLENVTTAWYSAPLQHSGRPNGWRQQGREWNSVITCWPQ
jgi:hypothetical protein